MRDSLRAEAAEHFGRAVEVEELERLSGGASRELWAFDAIEEGRRHRLVLRRNPREGEDPEGQALERLGLASDPARELEVLGVAHRHAVPVPEPLWLHRDGDGLVMRRVRGQAIARRLLREERYSRARQALTAQMAAAAATLHAVPLEDAPSVDAADGCAGLAAIEGMEAELDRLGEPHPALELGLRWLRGNLPAPRRPVLVHGDFRLGNVLVDEDGLVAVLDWELCHAGDPVEDLGWLCIRSWRFGSDQQAAAGIGTRDELLAAYRRAGGVEVSRDELFFWEVLGNVRWGVICLVQADTHLSGARRSLEHAAIGRRACEPEWDLLAMVG
jgi:aminoglycoside phosphotransferase (APT) family kinase protein